MASYEELRRRHVADAEALLPEMLGRLEWSAERLAAHRRQQLAGLLAVARERSAWHRERLGDLDPEGVDPASLGELPVMGKDDLMDHFDGIVTDPRLRLEVVERHLESLTGDAYLLERYHACASGGSSGRRGVFLYDWGEWTTTYWSTFRYEARARLRDPRLAGASARMAMVASGTPTHMSSSHAQSFSRPDARWSRFPVTMPTDQIVAGLNELRPTFLAGYPSALHVLAAEAGAGRLRIEPLRVLCVAEPLLPETREVLEATWGVTVGNAWGLSELGMAGVSCGLGPWLHLSDDLCVIEPVDVHGRPVPPGWRSDKIYLTNLFNRTLPLVRYEVTDQITLVPGPCPCGSIHQRIEDPQGRLDDSFRYRNLVVHPHVFRQALGRRPSVVEYQVVQTRNGADIAVRQAGPVDVDALEAEVARALHRLGLRSPRVRVQVTEHLERQTSGKLRRFVSLDAGADGGRRR